VKRVLALVAVVLLAGAASWAFLPRKSDGVAESTAVERLLSEGDVPAARNELDSVRHRIDAATADYLDGVVALHEGRDRDAVRLLGKARAARPDDWRIVGALAAALGNDRRFADALALLDEYVDRHPGDERGLATSAQYRLDQRRGTPDPAKALALLERIDALPQRVAPPGDRTAVPDSLLAELRAKAQILLRPSADALLDARAAVKAAPQDPQSWYVLGEAARRTGNGPEALGAYQRAAELAPGIRRYVEQYALARLELGVPDEPREGRTVLETIAPLLAREPQDPALLEVKARALVRSEDHRDPHDDGVMDEAADIYRGLVQREDAPARIRQDARRNLGILLYDWKQAGNEGEYLREAWGLLKRYAELGGEIDARLRPTYDDLKARYGGK
jgi:tetratricopeptide (TPR) repeat protein